MSRKSERRVGVLRCGAVLLAGLLAVSLLSGCGDGGAKQGSSAAAVSSSSAPVASSAASSTASESAGATASSPTSSSAGSGVASSATASAASAAPTSATTAASSSAEPTATATTDAESGTVAVHMKANEMPKKPAAPPKPQWPEAAFTQTKTGALLTGRLFFKELAYLQASGDTSMFSFYVEQGGCETCKPDLDAVAKVYGQGGFAIIGGIEVSDAKVQRFDSKLARVTMRIVVQSNVVYQPKIALKQTTVQATRPATVDMGWSGEEWVVTAYFIERA